MVSVGLLRDAERSGARLEALGSDDAPQARLLAGRVALTLRRAQDADRNLAAAARVRSGGGPALSRGNGWLAAALRAEAAGNSRRLLSACRRGSDLLEQYRVTLGASELRAQATARGAELAELAQRYALRSGRPRLLLGWSERWRATALAVPPGRALGGKGAQARPTPGPRRTRRLPEAPAD